MRITIERLRTWIVLLAVVLLAAILGFFGYARYRVRHVGRDLPGKLGLEIQQSTNGFTLSKSEGGRTLFTLHASKAVQYKQGGGDGGRAVLHDVSITLYGRDNAGADHVYGSEFEYDPATGVARANGRVKIDIEAPAGAGGAAGIAPGTKAGASTVHVTTSGLMFNQKTGRAETPETLKFTFAQSHGSAKGASYDSNEGLLVLQSAVDLHSEKNGSDVTIEAAHAEFDRGSRQLTLLKDQTEYQQTHSSSDQALVFFRDDGTAEKIDARGHVLVKDSLGRNLKSTVAEVLLDGRGAPQQVTFEGGLFFAALEADHDIHGDANTGVLQMGAQGGLEHVQMRNAASVVDQEDSPPGNPHGSVTRQVQATQIDIDLTTGDQGGRTGGQAEAKSILAKGGATVTEHTIYAKAMPQNTAIKGDQLFATLKDGRSLDTLRGDGNTYLTNTNPNGVSQTSSGDTLEVKFASEGPAKPLATRAERKKGAGLATPGNAPGSAISGSAIPGLVESAVQRGHLQMVETQPPAAGEKEGSRATASADRATFHGPAQTVLLEGGTPRLSDQGSELTAETIEFNRGTGAVTAIGAVRASYNGGSGGLGTGVGGGAAGGPTKEPAHAVAAKAVFDHGRDEVTFTGGTENARLWQGADSVSAPVLVLSRKQQTLTAHGDGSNAAVHAVFAGTRAIGDGAARPATKTKTAGSAVVRVSSVSLLYSAAERKATFKGNVVAQQPGATVRTEVAEIYLTQNIAGTVGTPKAPGPASGHPQGSSISKPQVSSIPNPQGALDRMVAQGKVQFEGGGRKGSGEKLVYTAADSKFVLTGTTAQPAQIVDPERGTVSGSSLIFTDRDDSVIVNGGHSHAVTETRIAN
ncbi:MAG: LptA/OstA family protein [Acidobacteriaceae bacterium]